MVARLYVRHRQPLPEQRTLTMTNQTRRTKSFENFSHGAVSVPSTGQSDINNPTVYNSTVNFYTGDEYLDLKIDFRFSLERGRR